MLIRLVRLLLGAKYLLFTIAFWVLNKKQPDELIF